MSRLFNIIKGLDQNFQYYAGGKGYVSTENDFVLARSIDKIYTS